MTALAFDPVCGMWLEPSQVAATHTYLGRTYSFCCTECRDLFVRDPGTPIVLLAHEPGQSIGHLCPGLRQALASQRGATEDIGRG